MIGAMQEFNYQYGVDSYMRIKWERKGSVGHDSSGRVYDGRLRFAHYLQSFSDNPSAQYKFYVDGHERADGVPWYDDTPYFLFSGDQKTMTVELRSIGPYIERVQYTQSFMRPNVPLELSYRTNSSSYVGAEMSDFIYAIEFSDGCGLKTIGTYAFQRMRNCDVVTLPATLTLIEKDAFYKLNRFCHIVCKAQFPPSTDGNTLFRVPSGTTGINARTPYDDGVLYVPKGSAQYYQAATRKELQNGIVHDTGETNYWQYFQNILELDY